MAQNAGSGGQPGRDAAIAAARRREMEEQRLITQAAIEARRHGKPHGATGGSAGSQLVTALVVVAVVIGMIVAVVRLGH